MNAQPPPTGRTDRPVGVFDGECRFCRAQAQRIRRLDRRGAFEFLARQDPAAVQRFPRLAEGDLSSGLRLVEPGGEVHVGADAVYRIARRIPVWRWAAWLYRVPILHRLLRGAYAVVAANRYRFAGRCEDGSCKL